MSYSYNENQLTNLKHLKKAAQRTQNELTNLASLTVGAIEEAVADKIIGNTRIYYGTSSTAASTQTKAVTISGDVSPSSLASGDIYIITFTNAQTYNGTPKLQIGSLTAANIQRLSGTNAARYEWNAGESLVFIWNGSAFLLTESGLATTTYYGRTKLSSSTSSTSEAMASTPKAAKNAYEQGAAISAPPYDANSKYDLDAHASYLGVVYKAKQPITTPEPWTASHWIAVKVMDEKVQSDVDRRTAVGLLINAFRQHVQNDSAIVDEGTAGLTNTQIYPFNNSQKSVALKKAQKSTGYVVIAEVVSSDGNAGEVVVSNKQVNGFKLEFTGSATSATVKYTVIGGNIA